METFSALLALCAGNSLVIGEFHSQRPVTRTFDVFFDLRLYKRLSKQSWGWWFETPSRPLWCQCNGIIIMICDIQYLTLIMCIVCLIFSTFGSRQTRKTHGWQWDTNCRAVRYNMANILLCASNEWPKTFLRARYMYRLYFLNLKPGLCPTFLNVLLYSALYSIQLLN